MPGITAYVTETKSGKDFGQINGNMQQGTRGPKFTFPVGVFGDFSFKHEQSFTINETAPGNGIFTGIVWTGRNGAVQEFMKP